MSIRNWFSLDIKAPSRQATAREQMAWVTADNDPSSVSETSPPDGREEAIQRKAMALPSAFVAAQGVAKIAAAHRPNVVRETGPDEEAQQIKNHEFERVLWRPNAWMSSTFVFWFTYLTLPVRGNAFFFVVDDGSGQGEVQELWPIPAWKIKPIPAETTEDYISHFAYYTKRGGKPLNLPVNNVCWVRQPNVFDLFDGMSSVAPLASTVQTDFDTQRYRRNFFGPRNAAPTTIFSLKKPMNKGQFEEVKEEILSELHVVNRASMVTRAGDIDVTRFGMSMDELGILPFAEWDSRVIKEVFGWSEALGAKDTTYASMWAARDLVDEHSVWPLMQLVSGAMSAQITRRRYGDDIAVQYKDIRPARRDADRADYTVYAQDRTINENRKEKGLDPITDGEYAEMCEAVPVRLLQFVTQQEKETPTGEGGESQAPPEVKADLDKWQRKALRRFAESGVAVVDFESILIPEDIKAQIIGNLLLAGSTADVKQVFAEIKTAKKKVRAGAGGDRRRATTGR